MRLTTAEHLIAAEDLADSAARVEGGRVDGGWLVDLDLDGIPEVRLAAPGQVLGIKLDAGAGIGAWDIRAVRHALACVMRRRPEAYHRTLIEAPDGGPFATVMPVASIHDAVRSKEAGLAGPNPLRQPRTPVRPGPVPAGGYVSGCLRGGRRDRAG